MYQAVGEQLVALLAVYGQLLQLAREKEPVLQTNNDLEALRSLTEREEALMDQAAQVERLRMEAVAKIAEGKGIDPEVLTVSALAEQAAQPEREALLAAAGELTEVLRQLRMQNDMNRQLLQMNLSFAAFVLDSTARETSLGDTYGASGAPAEKAESGYRLLDSEI
ncbi:MAG: flagellar protein FlgN [Candidatus Pelethousia sp.]|nr:flagellar protein FlgN [Candidatus Pelethousia sp.]